VRFKVQNMGSVSGDEVAQVYLGAPKNPPARVQFAVRALAGFERFRLQPGESRELSVHIDPRKFMYWSTANGK
jgi:beta-glucosidase